jgi:hypothetical protein
MPYKDKNKQREYQKKWARENRDKRRKYHKDLRKRVLEMMGGKCVYCDCDIFETLEINHKFGGGIKDRGKSRGSKGFLLDILAGRRSLDKLELVCVVCNAVHYLEVLKKLPAKWTVTWKRK